MGGRGTDLDEKKIYAVFWRKNHKRLIRVGTTDEVATKRHRDAQTNVQILMWRRTKAL